MQKICQQAEEMLSELEGLPLSMARKLDPCELYELLFGNSYVNYEEAPNGTQEKRVHFEFCIHGQCDVRIGEERLTGWSTDGELQRALRGFLGTAVEEAALGVGNVLRLRFPAGAIEFCPIPDKNEAWRLFSQDRARAHLVMRRDGYDFE